MGRSINLYYGECTFEPNTRVWSSVFPVTSQKGKAIFAAGLKLSQAIQTKADTVCEGKGIELTQNYLIYDECRNVIIDTFSVVLSPGAINNTWIDAPGDTIYLTAPPKVCRIGLPEKSPKALLELLQIKLNTIVRGSKLSIDDYSIYLKYSVKSTTQFDTICNGEGLKAIKTFTITDDCTNKIVDSFEINLSPNGDTSKWVNIPAEKKSLDLTKYCWTNIVKSKHTLVEGFGITVNAPCKAEIHEVRIQHLESLRICQC